MRILVAYASNSGNTRMTARRIGAVLARQHEVSVKNFNKLRPADLAAADALVIGSCSWLRQTPDGPKEGELPEYAHDFIDQARAEHVSLATTPVAVFGLGRHEYTKFTGAVDLLEAFVRDAGGRFIVRSLRIDGFPHHQGTVIDDWATQVNGALTGAAAQS